MYSAAARRLHWLWCAANAVCSSATGAAFAFIRRQQYMHVYDWLTDCISGRHNSQTAPTAGLAHAHTDVTTWTHTHSWAVARSISAARPESGYWSPDQRRQLCSWSIRYWWTKVQQPMISIQQLGQVHSTDHCLSHCHCLNPGLRHMP